mgnify:CR=1 FL=1
MPARSRRRIAWARRQSARAAESKRPSVASRSTSRRSRAAQWPVQTGGGSPRAASRLPHAQKGQLCGGDDRNCDSAPDAHDGECDACPLRGGVTTEDEMFILLGFYYVVPGA